MYWDLLNYVMSSPLTAGAAYNIGIFHWRPTEPAKKLAKEWKDMLLADDKIWDQNGFNELVRKQLGPSVDEESELVYAYDGSLKLGILPASIFCSGHTYFVQVGSIVLLWVVWTLYLLINFVISLRTSSPYKHRRLYETSPTLLTL